MAAKGLRVLLGVAVLLVAVLLGGCSGPANKSKPPGCPDVQAVFVPGTYETRIGADPAVPVGLLAPVADALRKNLGPDKVGFYFVPYLAQFGNPTPYPQSAASGVKATVDAMAATANKCPAAKFTLAGFSQGAAVAGDVATQIGQGGGPISPDKLLGVGLISDPNRNTQTESSSAHPWMVPASSVRDRRTSGRWATGSSPSARRAISSAPPRTPPATWRTCLWYWPRSATT